MGQALHEIVYATAPIAHLYRDLELGKHPGSFSIVNFPDPEMEEFITPRNDTLGNTTRNAVESLVNVMDLMSQNYNNIQESLKSLRRKFLDINRYPHQDKEDEAIPKARELAGFISNMIGDILRQNSWDMRILTLLPGTVCSDKTHEKLLIEILRELNFIAVNELYMGDFEALDKVLLLMYKTFANTIGENISVPECNKICVNLISSLKETVVVPEGIKGNMRADFEPVTKIEKIIENYANGFILEMFKFEKDRNKSNMGKKMKFLINRFIRESVSELLEGFENGYDDVKILLKHNIELHLKKFEFFGIGFILAELLSEPLQNYIGKIFNREFQEESKIIRDEDENVYEEEKESLNVESNKDQETSLKLEIEKNEDAKHEILESPLKNELELAMKSIETNEETISNTIRDISGDLEDVYIKYLQLEFGQRVKDDSNFDPTRQENLKAFLESIKKKTE